MNAWQAGQTERFRQKTGDRRQEAEDRRQEREERRGIPDESGWAV